MSTLRQRTSALYRAAYGTALPAVCCLGVVGSVLSLCVLSNNRFRKSQGITYLCLRLLAAADLLAALFWTPEILRLGWRLFGDGFPTVWVAGYYAHVSWPSINAFLATGSFLVVLVSLERYVAVCHPHRAKGFFSGRRLPVLLTAVLLLPAAFYLPSCWEYTVIERPVLDDNNTVLNIMYKKKWNSEFADSDPYRTGYKWTRITLFRILPVSAVIVLNALSARGFTKIVKRRKNLMSNKTASGRRKTSAAENRDELMKQSEEYHRMMLLIAIAVVFVLCQVPISSYHVMVSESLRNSWWFRVFTVAADMLDVLNAASHFYLYCLASHDFRTHLRRLCCCQRPVNVADSVHVTSELSRQGAAA